MGGKDKHSFGVLGGPQSQEADFRGCGVRAAGAWRGSETGAPGVDPHLPLSTPVHLLHFLTVRQ